MGGEASATAQFRYFPYVMAAFVAILLLSNLIGAAKPSYVTLPNGMQWSFGAGVLFFPVSYVLGDRDYSLNPTDVRTHKQCRTEELTFVFRRQEKKEVFRPKRGERLRVLPVRESNRLRVEVEREGE